jgi:hypothetical protein
MHVFYVLGDMQAENHLFYFKTCICMQGLGISHEKLHQAPGAFVQGLLAARRRSADR